MSDAQVLLYNFRDGGTASPDPQIFKQTEDFCYHGAAFPVPGKTWLFVLKFPVFPRIRFLIWDRIFRKK